MLNTPVKIFEIFKSINGEVTDSHQGSICTFVRLAGCNFWNSPCKWCDTKKSLNFSFGKEMKIGDILKTVKKLRCQNVTITGGEPLYQTGAIHKLIVALAEFGYKISLETNGSIDIDEDTLIYLHCVVADYKLPSSGCEEKMNIDLYKKLRECDFIKMGIADQTDLQRAIVVYNRFKEISIQAQVAFSPIINNQNKTEMSPKLLFNSLVTNNINDAIINIQLHKFFDFA